MVYNILSINNLQRNYNSTSSLTGMLLGRFLVGTGMGLGLSVASLYVAEVSPASVRGTFGSFTQIATCLGLMGSFLIGIPAKEAKGWWRVCFWVPVIPAAVFALTIEICAESPHWLFKKGRSVEAEAEFERLLGGFHKGRSVEAEAEFERLLGGFHVKSATAELSKSDRGDEVEAVKYIELFYGRHFKGSCIATILMDKLGRKVLLLGSFSGMVSDAPQVSQLRRAN
ncbi:hypothetical protein RND81_09G116000 [Saponaria officinalis]|uniref:Major facilitator superfamily (MFS) profile domain-containing protein n=1 Tax=Saponaria officinalis TaxID=3572 RepID=A0AAW1IKS9_SAPOF